jgi:SH3 domain protein
MLTHQLGLRKIVSLVFIPLLIMSCLLTTAAAETRYIRDVLVVDVRDSMESRYNKIATVKTGDAVEILEETKRFVKVKTSKGDVGYIAKQYVSTDIPKAKVINNLKYEMKGLKNKIAKLEADKAADIDKLQASGAQNKSFQQEISGLTEELDNAHKELEKLAMQNHNLQEKVDQIGKLTEERDQLRAEVKKLLPRIDVLQKRYDQALESNKEASEIIAERDALQDKAMALQADMEFLQEKHAKFIKESQDVVTIIDERDALMNEAQKNHKELQQLRERNDKLEGSMMVYWFLAGAGVLLVGLLIGRSTARRKRSMLT